MSKEKVLQKLSDTQEKQLQVSNAYALKLEQRVAHLEREISAYQASAFDMERIILDERQRNTLQS